MYHRQAVISAVLTTLLRATVDERTPVVLRTRRADQARELALWLEAVHGSQRIVIPSQTASGQIEVRLPLRMVWPPLVASQVIASAHPGPLATHRPATQFSIMATPPSFIAPR